MVLGLGFPRRKAFLYPEAVHCCGLFPSSDGRGGRRVRATKFRAPGLGQRCSQNGCRGGCTEPQGIWGCYQCLPPGSVEKGSKHARKDSAGHWPKNYLTSPIPALAQLCLASLGPYAYILIQSQNKCLNKGGGFFGRMLLNISHVLELFQNAGVCWWAQLYYSCWESV